MGVRPQNEIYLCIDKSIDLMSYNSVHQHNSRSTLRPTSENRGSHPATLSYAGVSGRCRRGQQGSHGQRRFLLFPWGEGLI